VLSKPRPPLTRLHLRTLLQIHRRRPHRPGPTLALTPSRRATLSESKCRCSRAPCCQWFLPHLTLPPRKPLRTRRTPWTMQSGSKPTNWRPRRATRTSSTTSWLKRRPKLSLIAYAYRRSRASPHSSNPSSTTAKPVRKPNTSRSSPSKASSPKFHRKSRTSDSSLQVSTRATPPSRRHSHRVC